MLDIQIDYLGAAKTPKKRKRYVEAGDCNAQSLSLMSVEQQQLLMECLKNGQNARWDTWQKIAGIARKTLLEALAKKLLNLGLLCVYEEKRSGEWWPYKTEFLHFSALKQALDLPNEDNQAAAWKTLSNRLQSQAGEYIERLAALEQLAQMPVARAITRGHLVLKLYVWQADARQGTYRDFSLFARDATKKISDVEWQWLDGLFDLASCGIVQHTPLFYIAANLQLQNVRGTIDLSTMPDFAALTPASLHSMTQASGAPHAWLLVENRTSFERVAKSRKPEEGVIWLPGFPPSWWKIAVTHLLKLAPAPAKIACDPDPAGIAIALSVMDLWAENGLEAAPWRMGVAELQSLKARQDLNQYDTKMLASLLQKPLPSALKVLAEFMQASKAKGEQEGYL